MNKKDETFLALRPLIDTIDLKSAVSEDERFQNNTLRPVIKLQHESLISCFKTYLNQHKINWDEKGEKEKHLIIANAYSKDKAFRNFNLGLISGCFTSIELDSYLQNRASLSKRIIQIIVQRIESVFCLN